MPNGKVKWFNMKHGYGFIIPEDEDAQKDVFIHASRLIKSGIKKLEDGQKVQYDVYDDNGKPAAENISIIN